MQSTDHNGWLICDGRTLSKADHIDLFDVIGYSFGGSGATFMLPNARGRVIGSIGSGSGLTTRALGDTIGQETHTMTINELPTHSHTGTTNASGSHAHIYNDAYFAEAGGNQINGNNVLGIGAATDVDNQFRWRTPSGSYASDPQDLSTSTAGNHTHTFTTGTTGSSQSFNVMQPTLLETCIRLNVEIY